MIDRQELAAALRSLDPRDREVLDLSLRRRVPDDALAHMYGAEVPEVARRRAAAIEHLAAELGIQRGADLGHVLQALLESETWEGVLETEEDAPAESGEAETTPEEPAPELPVSSFQSPEVEDYEEAPPAATEPEREPAAPVLEMLDERRPEPAPGRRSRRLSAALAAVATVLLPAAGIVFASTLSDNSGDPVDRAGSQTRSFLPHDEELKTQPFATAPEETTGYPVARLRRATVLYNRPGGKEKIKVPARTEWGSARILGVVRQSGAWMAVQVPELENGEVGWVESSRVDLSTVPWSLHVDLSERELLVRKDGHLVRRLRVAVGSPNHPTPEGRFSVTDKLKVSDSASPYGCCVLALSGHQVKLPEGWPGGDRLAVHATRDLSGIGQAVSLGCMRTDTDNASWLIRVAPLGAPIFIKA